MASIYFRIDSSYYEAEDTLPPVAEAVLGERFPLPDGAVEIKKDEFDAAINIVLVDEKGDNGNGQSTGKAVIAKVVR